MLFIYLNSLILLIGFELNVSITYLKDARDDRKLKEGNENESLNVPVNFKPLKS